MKPYCVLTRFSSYYIQSEKLGYGSYSSVTTPRTATQLTATQRTATQRSVTQRTAHRHARIFEPSPAPAQTHNDSRALRIQSRRSTRSKG